MTRPNDTLEAPGEFMPATSPGRALAMAALLCALAMLGIAYWLAWPALQQALAPDPAPQAVATVKRVLLGLVAIVVGCALVLCQTGYQILRDGRCPPANAWVWRRTRVRRGSAAVWLAWTYIVAAVASCLLCMAMVRFMWTTFDAMGRRPATRSAVTAFNQMPPGRPDAADLRPDGLQATVK